MKAFQVLSLGAAIGSSKEEKQKAVVEKNNFETKSEVIWGSILTI